MLDRVVEPTVDDVDSTEVVVCEFIDDVGVDCAEVIPAVVVIVAVVEFVITVELVDDDVEEGVDVVDDVNIDDSVDVDGDVLEVDEDGMVNIDGPVDDFVEADEVLLATITEKSNNRYL